MQDKRLFEMAAAQLAPEGFDGANSPAELRYEAAMASLRVAAAGFFDSVFDGLDADPVPCAGEGDPDFVYDVIDEYNGRVWYGESTTTTSVLGDDEEDGTRKEETKRWVSLVEPASGKFQIYAPPGFVVKKRTVIGAVDVRYSLDNGETWDEPDQAKSLEVITGLFISADDGNEAGSDALRNGSIQDPFRFGPVVIERTNDANSVFEENEVLGFRFSVAPAEQQYASPLEKIESIHASLDYLESSQPKQHSVRT